MDKNKLLSLFAVLLSLKEDAQAGAQSRHLQLLGKAIATRFLTYLCPKRTRRVGQGFVPLRFAAFPTRSLLAGSSRIGTATRCYERL